MENLTIFISLLFIVFGILQIILFFKMWGMTLNVSRIYSTLNKTTTLDEAKIEYLSGNKEKAKEILNRTFIKDLLSVQAYSSEEYKNQYNRVKSRYVNIYKEMDVEMPEFDIEKANLLAKTIR